MWSTVLCSPNSWLLHDPNMNLRSMYRPYLHAVEKYFKKLLPIFVPLQVRVLKINSVIYCMEVALFYFIYVFNFTIVPTYCPTISEDASSDLALPVT